MPTNNQRNNPCPCGSGKKYKKCCLNKKPRIVSITMDMGEPVDVNGVKISPTGSIELLKDGIPLMPANAYHTINFDRPKGPKILNKTPLDPNKLIIDSNLALEKFDRIFAIDTNTKTINDENVSVSCVVLCKLSRDKNDLLIAKVAPIHCLEFRNIQGITENIAWMKAIQLITANPSYSVNMKLGIIVDSDLGNISSYNNRSKPFYSDFYLPQNIELIYASTDVGKEYLANKLISLCDKEATKLLEDIALNNVSNENLHKINDEPYTHFRFWNTQP